MEIELKYLENYLSTKLEMIVSGTNRKGILCGLFTDEVFTTEMVQLLFPNGEVETFGLGEVEPCFRPLSDLTKEIEVNGIKGNVSESMIDKHIQIAQQGLPSLLPYHVFEFLLKFHFDVFGLIEKGLAIDINTL